MVGILDETFVRYPFGTRIRVGNNYGTVKYVGEVIGYTGIWLGIEWDEPDRGKHDGSLNGKKYFSTTHPTAGSFVRESKLMPFESVEDAIRDKYLSYKDENVDESLIIEAQQNLNAALFKIVGMDKVAQKQSKFEQLSEVFIGESPVNSAGYLKECIMLSTLNLNHTLVWNWRTIADICKQLPTLTTLNLNSNRLIGPTDSEVLFFEPAFRNLKHLTLGDCGIKQWNDILQIAKLWPNIESLGLQENDISKIIEPDTKKIFKKLKVLDLSRTKLSNFDEILKLGNIQTLTNLVLMENNITEIKLPDCEVDCKLEIFISLEQLDLLNNPIWDDAHTFNELDKLKCLKRLSKTPQMKSDFDEMFSKAVAHISGLMKVNKADVLPEERRGAEYEMWKRYATEWLEASKNPILLYNFYKNHRSYASLIRKYGSAAEFIPQTIKTKSKLILLRFRNEKTGEIWEKKVPRMITVQTLIGLCAKHFNLESSNSLNLVYIDSKYTDIKVPLENMSKSLDFYSLQNGDTVLLHS